ncbi:unnamed protein product [Lymnaea stagnalis]|uniref:H-type lectin domain-containing protein n=1 Tax=Lymnaea stagnalis TaxID=6523 RepID=A0AAV2IKJ8_LYMST
MSVCTIIALVLLSVLISTINADSLVTLEGAPSTIHPVLTKTLQLRCAVQSDSSSVTSQTTSLYNLITTPQPGSATDSPPQDGVQATSPSGSIAKLLSLVITKKNQGTGLSETLASVTGCNVPIIEEKFLSTFGVEGNSEGSNQNGELGYLVLTWDRPDEGEAGIYSCEAYALNSDKHPVSLIANLPIASVQPNIADLVTYISANEREITSLKSMVNAVAGENAALRHENYQLYIKTNELENRLTGLKGQNIQTGSFSCTYQEIPFPQPYNNTPIVFLSTASASISSSYSYSTASYNTNLQSVTPYSFTVSCSQSYFTTSFTWLAIDI